MYTDNVIATLGPNDTDAAWVAGTLSKTVVLKDSFRSAMAYGCDYRCWVLLSCGYVERNDKGIVTDTWVDLHFDYVAKMKVVHAFSSKTKQMCLVKSHLCDKAKTAVIHPSTRSLLNALYPGVEQAFVNNKPEAARLVASGKYDMTIASADTVNKFRNLDIMDSLTPSMVWALYAPIEND